MSIRTACIPLVIPIFRVGERSVLAILGRCVLVSVLSLAASIAPAADPSQYSEAERLLFVRPHLAALSPPLKLHYAYRRTGSLQPEVSDHATLILSMKDGSRSADVEYLSGDRRLELPPIDYVEQNPIVLHFLEREVRQLKELTGGSVSFYRNRIRKALAGDATVRQTQIDYAGGKVNGMEIRIAPFAGDPARARFEKFAERYYVMILSPEIPGEVYQLRADLPGPAGPTPDSVLHREVLTFERREQGG